VRRTPSSTHIATELSDMAFFGTWDADRIVRLGDLLAKVTPLHADGFAGLPEDSAFWADVTAQCNEGILARVRSNELCACAHIEIDSLDVCEIQEGEQALFLSNVSSGMSRLAHAILGTSQLVLIGGAPTLGACNTWDRRPRPPGSTCWIDTTQTLAPQLVDAARFANKAPTIVASPDGLGVGAVVCAAILAAREGLSSSAALREVEKRRGPLRVEMDDEEELGTFCQRLLLAEFDLRLGVPSTPTSRASKSHALSPVKRGASAQELPAAEAKRKARKRMASEQPDLDGWKLA